jgi:hypothetical protein
MLVAVAVALTQECTQDVLVGQGVTVAVVLVEQILRVQQAVQTLVVVGAGAVETLQALVVVLAARV